MINSGGVAEQLVGQLLRSATPAYIPPSLYYWQRGKKGAEAEIDYIIQNENQVIPIIPNSSENFTFELRQSPGVERS
jgi:uncharacterized protein